MFVEQITRAFADSVQEQLLPLWSSITKSEIEQADRRRTNRHDAFTTGSFIYVAYEGSTILYVGETGTSIKKRFTSHGSGAHNRREWYGRISEIRYVKLSNDEFPEPLRKMVEQLLSWQLQPLFYGRP